MTRLLALRFSQATAKGLNSTPAENPPAPQVIPEFDSSKDCGSLEVPVASWSEGQSRPAVLQHGDLIRGYFKGFDISKKIGQLYDSLRLLTRRLGSTFATPFTTSVRVSIGGSGQCHLGEKYINLSRRGWLWSVSVLRFFRGLASKNSHELFDVKKTYLELCC